MSGVKGAGGAGAVERVKVRRAVLTCRRCPLSGGCTRPVPWSGPAPNRALVVGEAPGKTEDARGEPFVGAAGKLLRRLMREAGIDGAGLAWTNTVACFPHRTPNRAEVRACAGHLLGTIRVVAPEHVLLVGGVALSVWRPDLRITSVHGRPFRPAGWWAYPVHHPAAALRDPGLALVIRRDLERWRRILAGGALDMVSEECARCGRAVERYDPDGIPWCAVHLKMGRAGWDQAVAARSEMSEAPMYQEAMGL